MLLDELKAEALITPPKWMNANLVYLARMGSDAYGVAMESSDIDIHGVAIPPKDDIFPHLSGEIRGFGTQRQPFNVWEQHHVMRGEKEYDFTVYSIVKFFHLVMGNNPNMLDFLFVPRRCVIHATTIGNHIRENRKLFLSKSCAPKLRGYAYSQLAKIKTKQNASNPKRAANIAEFGYDIKFAYHVVRLVLQCEQILLEGDLDLERNLEILKSIRRGEWTLDKVDQFFSEKEKSIESLVASSTLQATCDEDQIKALLMDCLEQHYGSLSQAVQITGKAETALAEIQKILDRTKE